MIYCAEVVGCGLQVLCGSLVNIVDSELPWRLA
jgi:hypothetical protein